MNARREPRILNVTPENFEEVWPIRGEYDTINFARGHYVIPEGESVISPSGTRLVGAGMSSTVFRDWGEWKPVADAVARLWRR